MQQGIKLNQTQAASNGSAIKAVALATFRFLRSAGDQAAKAPGIVQHTAGDIVDAWHESAGAARSKP